MDKIWKAKWIMDEAFEGYAPIDLFHKQISQNTPQTHEPALKNRHMQVRKKFIIDQKIKTAHIDITADDYYKLYVNGRFIGQGPAPAYHFNYNYNRYDVSEFLKEGENVIAVHVYYQGLVNRVWNSGDYRQGMICELFTDGALAVSSDSSWKYSLAREFTGERTTGYETQYLEDIDANLKEKHWREIKYDDSLWKNTLENPLDDHQLLLQSTPPLQVYKLQPETVKKLENGQYLIDFGKEITGQFYMEANGEKNQPVIVMCGEELQEDGLHVRYAMRCNCEYKETWVLSGEHDILEYYDYKTFRYVEVHAPVGVVKPESFSAIVRHYLFDEQSCRFNTSDEMLNSIWNICREGVKCGSQEAFVDCPSREKGQYLGDNTIITLSHFYLTGDLRLFKKALKDFALSTFVCPGIMAVAPGNIMQEIADFSLQWPLQLLNYYKHSGDKNFLEEMVSTAEGIITYFKKYAREDGLIENVKEKWNLVDWPDNLRDGYDFDLSTVVGDGCHNVINAFYCGAVKVVNEIKNILGSEIHDDFERLKASFIKAFYNEASGLFVDSTVSKHSALHSNSIALFYGLVPENAISSVVEFIKEKRLACGVYNAYFLLKGLAAVGEYDLVYELITCRDKQSWANMVSEGATTCFEAWGKEQKWNTSLCHPWASAPIPVFIEDIIGLKPLKPGWEEVAFDPHIPASLKRLFFECNVGNGKVRLEYETGNTKLMREK